MDTSEKEIYSALIVILSIIGILLFYFIFSIVRQHRRYKILAKAKMLAEISTIERERKRIAGDLHDEIGPLLSAVKLQINHLEGVDSSEQTMIEKSSQYIDDVIKRMREISNDLLPSILVRRGLKVALDDFLEKVIRGSNTTMEADITLEGRLPLDLEINIYRVVHEIVHNALKHAQAKKFRLELGMENGVLRLATADDGVGFSNDVYNRRDSGLGLLNLQSRTEVLGGELFCQSAPGKGTQYLIEIPLTDKWKI